MSDADTWTPERIRELRLARGWTQQQLADRIGYKLARSVSDLEASRADGTPRSRPSRAVVVALDALASSACERVAHLWTDADAGPMAESTRWRVRADWPDFAEVLDALAKQT